MMHRVDALGKAHFVKRHFIAAAAAITLTAAIGGGAAVRATAHSDGAAHNKGITAKSDQRVKAAFDIVQASVTTEANSAVFRMQVSGKAGSAKPSRNGKLAGSRVFSYVWPTSLDPSQVGFPSKSGILAFAVTSHRDFDDTPLFDENADGSPLNDGNLWHSHWVVLAPDESCGKGSLKVVDIETGTKPKLPKTWPGLPILIDSPGWSPVIGAKTIEVRVPFDDIASVTTAKFDGVTAGLRVNESTHSPLLCVEDVFKIASGDLSLPGTVNR